MTQPHATRPARGSLALLTDLYQLTMALGYFRSGLADRDAVFHWYFRREPFDGDYAIAAGHETLADYLAQWRFDAPSIDYLAGIRDSAQQPLFPADFLQYLADLKLTVDIDAVREGTVVHAHEPLFRVRGPLAQCQLIETPLLNILNFQTLIATKAARVASAAAPDPVLEFGLRRAQGIDGALAASRAAYIGGCAATSNVLAGMEFGIPVRGTHAHSWVMCFDSEIESFRSYAAAMPNNCVFLVDTYDTVEGVKNAIVVGHELRKIGSELAGVRLDSGDLAGLSIAARKLLDEAGFPDAKVVASNDLDEAAITELKRNGAQIAVWGVGTKLVTSYDQPALGGVYKLAALADDSGSGWDYRLKLSEQPIKVSTPGLLQIRRYDGAAGDGGDVIYDIDIGANVGPVSAFAEPARRLATRDGQRSTDLLEPLYRGGKRVGGPVAIDEIRQHAADELARCTAQGRSGSDVYIEDRLAQLKARLIETANGGHTRETS